MVDLGMRAYLDGVLVDAKDTPNFDLHTEFNDARTTMGYFQFYTASAADFSWDTFIFARKAFSAAEVTALQTYVDAIATRDWGAYTTPPPFVMPPAPPETAFTPVATAAPLPLHYKGVNLSAGGNNMGPQTLPYGWTYAYPQQSDLDYFHSKGFRTHRVGTDIARCQPTNFGPLVDFEMDKLHEVIEYARGLGDYVIINPHNFGQMWNTNTGSFGHIGANHAGLINEFADFWKRVAQRFKNYPNVMYGLMNEPNAQTAAEWKEAAVAALAAIRTVTTTQTVLLQGTSYTAAYNWATGSGNAEAWAGFTDPSGGPILMEMHNYLDSDNSGQSAICTPGAGSTRLNNATTWARANNIRLYLGEFGGSQDASCTPEIKAFLDHMDANADVWAGWSWFTGGPFFGDNYIYNINPTGGVDKPQLIEMQKHLGNTL